MEFDEAIQAVQREHQFVFKEKQYAAIKSIVSKRDTFIVLPTGYGKTNIFAHLPEIYSLMNFDKTSILVISPLQSLMINQAAKLKQIGINTTVVGQCQDDKNVSSAIMNGDYSIVFSSPEAALASGHWRKCFTTGTFNENIQAVIIDEAHCITEWGGEFREDYGKLAQLRSIVSTHTTFVALTATATKGMQNEILQKLDMDQDNVSTIYTLPDRHNVAYFVQKGKKSFEDLDWILFDLIENRTNAKKTIVYCRNIASCAQLYEYFSLNLKECTSLENRLVAMFHRSTAVANKNHVLNEFIETDSSVRVVFATMAFGMGVDVPDIDYVIHWGAPRGLEQFAQESGRAGRDGRQSLSVVYYSGHDISKDRTSSEMRDFCKSTGCLREVLNTHFKLMDEDNPSRIKSKPCQCCCFCISRCKCGQCLHLEFLMDFKSEMASVPLDVESDSLAVRFCDDKLNILQDNLFEYKECLEEENSCHLVNFDMKEIEAVVKNSEFLLCIDDIIDLGISNLELAQEILLLIQEVDTLNV